MVFLAVHLADELTLCFMLIPPRAKVDINGYRKMAYIAEFIVRVNYELELESIQMDFDAGIISMRRMIEWTDNDVPSKELIWNAIRHMVYSYEVYAVGLIAVFMLNKEPSETLKACWQNERNKGEFERIV